MIKNQVPCRAETSRIEFCYADDIFTPRLVETLTGNIAQLMPRDTWIFDFSRSLKADIFTPRWVFRTVSSDHKTGSTTLNKDYKTHPLEMEHILVREDKTMYTDCATHYEATDASVVATRVK